MNERDGKQRMEVLEEKQAVASATLQQSIAGLAKRLEEVQEKVKLVSFLIDEQDCLTLYWFKGYEIGEQSTYMMKNWQTKSILE